MDIHRDWLENNDERKSFVFFSGEIPKGNTAQSLPPLLIHKSELHWEYHR